METTIRPNRPLSLAIAIGILASLGQRAEAQDGGGETADAAPQVGGFFDIVFSGGWFGSLIILALLILSMVAVYLIVEQIMLLRRSEIMP
ncbi:MAG TPA: hypothetical protein DDW52_19360, partial [Planctomycetaceae bacterium]|nr:hypothetical protein [Planctomycetaceae bacterium]